MAGMGHEDAIPRPRLSARCRFSQRTFAGPRATGETRRKRTLVGAKWAANPNNIITVPPKPANFGLRGCAPGIAAQ